MIEVGGRPLLWHVMKLYAHHGFDDLVRRLTETRRRPALSWKAWADGR